MFSTIVAMAMPLEVAMAVFLDIAIYVKTKMGK